MPMPTLTDITGLLGIALALAATITALPGVRRWSRLRLGIVFAVVALGALVPFGTLSVAECLRGALGDLSITTLVLLGGATLRRLNGPVPKKTHGRLALLGFIAVAALGLYPMALGVGLFDPYRLGYGSPWLVGALFAVTLTAWFRRFYILALCLALAVLAWSVRWYESGNLWDYLLDPLVSLYALGGLALSGIRWWWWRPQHAGAPGELSTAK
jgi:hypothetical protein